ncbi:MAG TPA: hypothetical protein VL201_04470 [Patescibacteria group bacterium]|jgi:hypothetical protein|nr:hypothetical protein [Patescibacteria group bacterium]
MLKILFFSFLIFTTHHSLFLMEEAQVGSFTMAKHQTAKKDGIIPITVYENLHEYYVGIRQTFPMELETNVRIKQIKRPTNYDVEGKILEEICPDEPDPKSLNAFLKSFLGKENETSTNFLLKLPYTVEFPKTENQPTIIKCCHMNNTQFHCFSLVSKLTAVYFKNESSEIRLHPLNDNSKERTLKFNPSLQLQALFLQNCFLIVGYKVIHPNSKIKYHIDIYNAEAFAGPNSPATDEKNSDVPYHMSIDIKHEKTDKNSTFNLLTIDGFFCVLQTNKTKEPFFINFLNTLPKVETAAFFQIIYSKENSFSISEKSDKKSWFHNSYVQIAGITAIVLFFGVFYTYFYKK